MNLVKVTIVQPFQLNEGGNIEKIMPGTYEWPEDKAKHWMVQAHSDKPPKTALAVGSAEYAGAMRLLVQKRQEALDEAKELLEDATREMYAQSGMVHSRVVSTMDNPKPAPLLPVGADAVRQLGEPGPAGAGQGASFFPAPTSDTAEDENEREQGAESDEPPSEEAIKAAQAEADAAAGRAQADADAAAGGGSRTIKRRAPTPTA